MQHLAFLLMYPIQYFTKNILKYCVTHELFYKLKIIKFKDMHVVIYKNQLPCINLKIFIPLFSLPGANNIDHFFLFLFFLENILQIEQVAW